MFILGLDPGSRHTGYGLVERSGPSLTLIEAGTFSYPSRLELCERLTGLAGDLRELVERSAPAVVALESPFHGINSRSLIVLAQARGALLSVLGSRSLAVREYSPAEVKSAVTGNGRAAKDQVARMVRLLLSCEGALTEDASDAVAVAVCAAKRLRMDRISAQGASRK